MSLIDTIKEMGSIAVITIVFGVFLSLLINCVVINFDNSSPKLPFCEESLK